MTYGPSSRWADEGGETRVGRDPEFERAQRRGADVHTAPMFTVKRDVAGADTYLFVGSDMDDDPLVK